MRKVLVLVTLAAAILVSVMLVLGGPSPAVESMVAGRQGATQVVRQASSTAPSRGDAGERAQELRERATQRVALRQRITEAMHAREVMAASEQRRAAGQDDGPAAATRGRRAGEPGAADEAPPAGAMIDRTGNHAYLTRVMSQELMPLADECYDLARAQRPELAGMLVLDVEILGDEELGGVIDSVVPGAANELVDPGLLECVRESLLSTVLPPPELGGRDQIALSMRFSPDEAE
jgi:hypothetical protein